jgi:hypothetical protein
MFYSWSHAIELPPYQGFNVTIDGTISEKYTDNVTFSEEDKEEAFLTTFDLGLDIKYQGKRRMLEFSSGINRQASKSSITNPSENLSLRFVNEFSRYDQLIVTNTFSHTRVPTSFEEEFGRTKGRFNSFRNSFNLSYNMAISRKLSVTTNYVNGLFWSSSEDVTDSRQNNFGCTFLYKHSVVTSGSLSYNLATSEFEEGGHITSHSISTGLTQYITKRLFFQGKVGLVFIENNINISSTVSFNNAIDKKTNAKILFTKGTQIRTDREDTFRNWRITGEVSRVILEDLKSSISGFYGKGKFTLSGVEDRLLGANINLNTVLWKHKKGNNLTGNFGYTFSNLDSTNKSRERTRSDINLGVTLSL